MKFKTCTVCKEEKVLSLFNKRGGKEPGYTSFCKKCKSEKDAKRYDSNKRRSLYFKNHAEEKEIRRKYYQQNKEKYYISKANRRAQEIKATPLWYSDFDSFVLSEAYALCKLREKLTGVKWEIDHVVPLKGDSVCGLHWHKNWSVITQFENRSKGNR